MNSHGLKAALVTAVCAIFVLNYMVGMLIPMLPFIAAGMALLGMGLFVYSKRRTH
jgi:LPXTG-motif cell wall-anchored protein